MAEKFNEQPSRREVLAAVAGAAAAAIGSEAASSSAPIIRPIVEISPNKGSVETLKGLFTEAYKTLEMRGRDAAKPYLSLIYMEFGALNKRDPANWKPAYWNKAGYLTEEEFKELDRQRKKLSNDIGMMTASGVVRHDLNEV